MSWFKKKETLDGYSEDTHWGGFPTTMCSRPASKNEKCGNCGRKLKKEEWLTHLTAGNSSTYCKECIGLAEDNLIAQCPHHYLLSFEEYKKWKARQK